MIYKRFEDIKVGDVYLFTGRDFFLEGKKVRVIEPGEYVGDDEITIMLASDTGEPHPDHIYYTKQSELTELDQQENSWEWGIARGRDALVDPHRTGMSEEQAREWVRDFEEDLGGRKGAFLVIKRPIGKWEVV